MRIGLLAYHSACNFGATLQLFSSYMYLLNHQQTPVIINWIPEDLERYYRNCTPKTQFECQASVRKQLWKETDLCRNSQEVAQIIEKEGIDAVIVGSDAVAQCHPSSSESLSLANASSLLVRTRPTANIRIPFGEYGRIISTIPSRWP